MVTSVTNIMLLVLDVHLNCQFMRQDIQIYSQHTTLCILVKWLHVSALIWVIIRLYYNLRVEKLATANTKGTRKTEPR